jgi:hypothetical protein
MNPSSSFWRAALPEHMDADAHGHPVPKYRTEAHTLDNAKSLFFVYMSI